MFDNPNTNILSLFYFNTAGNGSKKIDCPVMNVVGDNSPHIDDSMWFNGRLNPAKSTFVKVKASRRLLLSLDVN